MLAVSALRKIERQTRYTETAAQAAAESAKAALLLAQTQAQAQAQQAEAQAQAERPWILITAEPAPGVLNGFTVVATNRGRGPARIVSLAEEVTSATDESQLPPVPAFTGEPAPSRSHDPAARANPRTSSRSSRDDVKSFCENEERMRRVENWEEKIYLYGTVAYRGSAFQPTRSRSMRPRGAAGTSTADRKSGMVMAGPPQYNRHT